MTARDFRRPSLFARLREWLTTGLRDRSRLRIVLPGLDRPAECEASQPDKTGRPGEPGSEVWGGRAYQLNPVRWQLEPHVAEPLGDDQFASLSEVMNPRRYDHPDWLTLHYELESYSYDEHVFHKGDCHIVRKGWEWTHCIYGLQKLGAIRREARGLGVGAGREPVIFYLMDRISHVVATDLYGAAAWSKNVAREAEAAITADAQPFCKRPIRPERLAFKVADGTDLPFDAESFDIIWSLSSIEHFGGHDQAAAAMREMGRVTAPGGIVALATEYLLLEELRHPNFFNRADLEASLIAPAREMGLELADTPSFDTLPTPYLVDSVPVPQDEHRLRRHVVLNDGDVQWTSIMLFFQKPLEPAGPS